METILNVRPGQVAIVIGIDHKIQHFVPGLALNDPRTILRLRFHDFLRGISSGAVDVICEEAKHGMESIAETVAKRGGICYRNIEMSPRESDMLHELLGAITGARGLVVICRVSHMPVLIQALQPKFDRIEQYDVTAMLWFEQSLL